MNETEKRSTSSLRSRSKAYIFDFDGTISDTFHIHESAFEKALDGYDVKFDYKDHLGQTTDLAITRILEKNKIVVSNDELKKIVRSKRAYANELIHTDSKFIADADIFLRKLYEAGVTLYIASSGSRLNVLTGIKALGIKHYFRGVVTADDVTYSKPHPEIYINSIEKFQLDKNNTVVVEDAISGIQAALSAGLPVICINDEIDILPFLGQPVQYSSFSELVRSIST